MSFTRAQLRSRVLLRMDAAASARWDTSAGGEVDQVLGFVFDKEWRRILSANPFYNTVLCQTVTDSSGRIQLAGLTTGTGDSVKRFFRVLGVIFHNAFYQEVDAKTYLMAPQLNVGYRVWYRSGAYLQLLPVEASYTATLGQEGVWVSYLPVRPDNLADDASVVEFPDGYEEILVLEAAAFLLAKGGAETQTTAEFRSMAEGLRQDLLSDVARTSINPLQMRYADNAGDWGAV